MFRPCIDLHQGRVKQIVGGTLRDDGAPSVNFESDRSAAWFARRYRDDGLYGGHVIMLGPGNDTAAREALAAFPGGLHVGGGITPDNARDYLDAGASHVIVTSYVFHDGKIDLERLARVKQAVGRERLVLDLSCRLREGEYVVATNRWQHLTDVKVNRATLHALAEHCAEYLVHAVDVEGLCKGVDLNLVERLAHDAPLPVTYAGGAHSLDDLRLVHERGLGRVDLTIGSALDIFGGTGVRYQDCVAFNREIEAGV